MNFTIAGNASSTDKCKIESSQNNIVSLGFPLRSERLANKKEIKILIVPFQLKNEPEFQISSKEKAIFDSAAKNIEKISNYVVKIQLKYSPTISANISSSELDKIKNEWQKNPQLDFENSTFGFASQMIAEGAKINNYSNSDAVILLSKSQKVNAEIAEAMMFTRDPNFRIDKMRKGAKWFDPIETQSGEVSNIALIYNHLDEATLTHEIMHLFGLTDLYGSNKSPSLTLMSDNTISLLPFERWILGWLSDENIQCSDVTRESLLDLKNGTFLFDLSKEDQLIVLPFSSTTAIVLTLKEFDQTHLLSAFELNNEERPPLKVFSASNISVQKELVVDKSGGVSNSLETDDYILLITDYDKMKLKVNLIPRSIVTSKPAQLLIELSKARKSEIEALQTKTSQVAKPESINKPSSLAKKTITCLKGKIIKKVIAVNPVCPPGYSKK